MLHVLSSDPLQAAQIWRTLFLAALGLGVLLKAWLAWRQMRHVQAHRGAVPPAFAHTVSLPAHQKAADYTVTQSRFGLLNLLLGTLLLLGWTLGGGLQALHGLMGQWFHSPMLQQLGLLAGFALIGSVLDLPLDWYRTFRLEARFGFNTSTLGLWLGDWFKNMALGAVIGLPLAALILWLMQQVGSLWWLWAWAVWASFGLLMTVIYPSWIAPLFNRFEPLQDPELVQRVTALMQRCGFAAKGFYVMDGSKRSAHANAYFTGLGRAKRVVFFDTLLSKLHPGEVDAVLAHELGHFKHRHIQKRLLLGLALNLAGFALLGWLYGQDWFYAGLGVAGSRNGPHAALALLLFALAAPVFTLFAAPIAAASSRKHEFEADAFAAQHSAASDLSSALLKLYNDNAATLTPDPLYVRFYYSHPPASERLACLADLAAGLPSTGPAHAAGARPAGG
ncbi:MAG: M48 family metallopeptidase [Brachymonas sp.]|nr:M48 family metallopeptidase [Brachymonas sp.]